MFLSHIKLKNFRNHTITELSFDTRLIFFIGENGSGKTNILEAIHLLTILKSFRENSLDELVHWQKEDFYISGSFIDFDFEKKIEFGYLKKDRKRKLKLGGQEKKRKLDLIGEFKSILLSPVDLIILDGGPQVRRKYIDAFLATVDDKYLHCLVAYNRALKQRNALLKKRNISQDELKAWDIILVENGQEIIQRRNEAVSELNEYFQIDIAKISGDRDSIYLEYKPNINPSQDYSNLLEQSLSKDIALGYTTIGIHRDNLFIGKEKKDISHFGSQGQKRSTVIAMKTSVFKLIKNKYGLSPILLIDDVIRELDIRRREYFVDLITECGQVFFTTTDLEGISTYVGALREQHSVYFVKSGIVNKQYD